MKPGIYAFEKNGIIKKFLINIPQFIVPFIPKVELKQLLSDGWKLVIKENNNV